MTVLQPEEYDISYFDGRKATYTHNAGYTEYKRHFRFGGNFLPGNESKGEYFKDLAGKLNKDYSLQGKKFLELGSAYGFVVEDLREMGADAWGLDVSQYAYEQASETVKPYLVTADVRTHLSAYKDKEFDVVFGKWFLECISDTDLPDLVNQTNRISKLQVYIVRKGMNPRFYNVKTVQSWINDFNWQKGTIFIPDGYRQKTYIK